MEVNNKLPRKFYEELLNILLKYVEDELNVESKVVEFHQPAELKEILTHRLELKEDSRNLEEILGDCRETLRYCVKIGHRMFLNQITTGIDFIGLAGEWLSSVVNANMFTYEVAPVFTLMEDAVLKQMLSLLGWEGGEGMFSPGGSISNLYGMLCARHSKDPEIKRKGMRQEFVVFTSEQSHFSIQKSAVIMGIGTDNVITITCDNRGRMDKNDLEQKIFSVQVSGKIPLMVVATSGTTVLGAFDPLNEIAQICEENEIWLHVDGALGGSVLLSEEYRYLIQGIERADSLTWNPHKMMGVPLQCSVILLKKKGIIHSANAMHAEYLFPEDKIYDTNYDTGDKAIQCGRHNDVFKLWLMWRSKGNRGFRKQIDRSFALSRYLLSKIKENASFKPVLEEIEGANVCFWYIPPRIKAIEDEEQRSMELHKVAPKLKAIMMEKGSMMVGYQVLGNLPNFFRIPITNPVLKESDIDTIIEEFERIAAEL